MAVLKEDQDRIRELADKANQAHWCYDDYICQKGDGNGFGFVFECGEDDPPLAHCDNQENARYIASVSPPVVLGLLTRIEELEHQLLELTKHDCESWRWDGLGCAMCNPHARESALAHREWQEGREAKQVLPLWQVTARQLRDALSDPSRAAGAIRALDALEDTCRH